MREAKRKETLTERWQRRSAFNEKASTIFVKIMLAVGVVVILYVVFLLWQKG